MSTLPLSLELLRIVSLLGNEIKDLQGVKAVNLNLKSSIHWYLKVNIYNKSLPTHERSKG